MATKKTKNKPSRAGTVAREDLVLFINACFACTGQNEFYGGRADQTVPIAFLHDYVLGNYRKLYARTLAVGINHFNQAQVIHRLLATGKSTPSEFREEEGALIRTALRNMPPQRVLRLFARLAAKRVNNRRTRAVMRDWLASRQDPAFDAVKYRAKVRVAAAHAHLELPGETGPFLFDPNPKGYETQIFESFRQAHFAKSAVYDLPLTVAEGFADKHGIPREEFLKKIEPRLTQTERLRLQGAAQRVKGVAIDPRLEHLSLTKLSLFVLSLSAKDRLARREELLHGVRQSAQRTMQRDPTGSETRRIAFVLDRSYSTSGSSQKRQRPLGVALAAAFLLPELTPSSKVFWSPPLQEGENDLEVAPSGQTNLVDPLIDALEWGAEMVVLISDGFENDPPAGVEQVIRAFREHLDTDRKVTFAHVNPVFDADNFQPRTIGPSLPTVGVRDAEDIPTMLAFARFVDGSSNIDALDHYMGERSRTFIGKNSP